MPFSSSFSFSESLINLFLFFQYTTGQESHAKQKRSVPFITTETSSENPHDGSSEYSLFPSRRSQIRDRSRPAMSAQSIAL